MQSASYTILACIFFIIISLGVACTLSIIQTDTGEDSRAVVNDTQTEKISPDLNVGE